MSFFSRLHINPTTTSLTRVLFRRGVGGELWSTLGVMGLKQLTALSSHVRYQISLTLEDEVAAKALQEAYVDDVSNYEKFGECNGISRECLHTWTEKPMYTRLRAPLFHTGKYAY